MQVDPDAFTPPASDAELDDWLDGLVAELAAEMRAAARRVLSGALDAWAQTVPLTAAGDPQPLDVIDLEWSRIVISDLYEPIGGMHRAGALSAWINLEGHLPTDPNFYESFGARWTDVVNDHAVDYQRAAFNRLSGASEAMWGDVRARTVNAIADGWTNEQLKDEIERTMGVVEQRADAIARTEAMAAYNNGNAVGHQAMGSYGPTDKEWFATSDARTRPSHAEAHGQVVPIDQPFTVGGTTMMHPHDPAAPAGEVVHCRCRCRYYFAGDTLPDGTIAGGEASDIPGENIPVEVTPPEVERGVPQAGWGSWSEARTYLESRHPGVYWDDADMSLWDRRTVRDVAVWADDLAERFPEHWAQMRYVGSRSKWRNLDGLRSPLEEYDWAGGEIAHANVGLASQSNTGTYIAINPRHAADYDEWMRLETQGRGVGWTIGHEPIDTLYHEFGHIMHGSMHRLTADAIGNVGAPYQMITGQLKAPIDQPFFHSFDQWFWGHVKKKAETMGSKYGSTNLVEAAAETLNASLRRIGPTSMQKLGDAWIEVGDLFRTGSIDFGKGHQLDAPARYIVGVDEILAKHGIKARPKWPMNLSVEDAKAWIDTGQLP